MKVIILAKPEQVDEFAGKQFLDQVKKNPHSIFTLPTGSSPLGMYQYVRNQYRLQKLDFSGLTVRNLDEYWPLPSGSPYSYATYMSRNLFNHVNIPFEQCHIPNCSAPDPHIEATRYESLIQTRPSDYTFVGIGPGKTCHMGFNERGSTVNSHTRYVELDSQTREANAKHCGGETPHGAITQGIHNILNSYQITLIAKGGGKAWGIHRTLKGEVGPDAPASYLRLHPRVTVIIDKEAASLLQ